MDIKEILEQAAKAVEEADLPDYLKVAAFEKAVDLSVGATAGEPGAEGGALVGGSGKDPGTEDGSDWVGQIASKLGITPELVQQVYSYDDGELGVEIPHQWLGNSKKDGMLDLTRIVAAGRQALELETVTSTKVIRPILDEYGVRDANYSTYLDELGNNFTVKPDGKNKTVRASKPALTTVGERITELAGG